MREKIKGEGFILNYNVEEDPPATSLNVSHCHDDYEILFIISGEGRYLLEGTAFTILPGSLIFIKPFEYHCVAIDKDVTYERYVINFSRSALTPEVADVLDAFLQDGAIGGRVYSSSHLSETLQSIFSRFSVASSIAEKDRKERDLYLKLVLSELVLLLTVSKCEAFATNEEELGARVIKYLNENISRNLSLDHLAKRFFVSKYYLCRAFKNHNGISVHGYINQKRVMYAKQLIDSGVNASSAAYKVGFGDYSSFYRAYVKIIGKSPTAD